MVTYFKFIQRFTLKQISQFGIANISNIEMTFVTALCRFLDYLAC